ncbi:hypothetical protein H7H73_20115 [Mycobacterium rufum]|uniref:Uncharacterized protein n=1 Tax=Mycolicibacterium rufum TaxID=318424 RepID=A0A9X3BIR9_9MYCO|nr:hypothetical protein [Mycolicibacterium rufum]
MDDGGDLVVPAECVAWCRGQDVGVSVCDDMAEVDLEWWNARLARHAIPTRIVGRDVDGLPTDHGVGYLRRADLIGNVDGGVDATRHVMVGRWIWACCIALRRGCRGTRP